MSFWLGNADGEEKGTNDPVFVECYATQSPSTRYLPNTGGQDLRAPVRDVWPGARLDSGTMVLRTG